MAKARQPNACEQLIAGTIERYRYLSAEVGFTHEQFEEYTGVPASTFSMLLTGYRPLARTKVLSKLIDGLDKFAKY